MKHLITSFHPSITSIEGQSIINRKATRAIVLDGEDILLLFTQRYHDYSLPGGGLDEGEDLVEGLCRELKEETGARNISDIEPFGIYEEYRPWYKDNAEVMHVMSYCFMCKVERELGMTSLEDYEISNGMTPVWVNIHKAIEHNEQTIASSSNKGMSIERETYLLKQVASLMVKC